MACQRRQVGQNWREKQTTTFPVPTDVMVPAQVPRCFPLRHPTATCSLTRSFVAAALAAFFVSTAPFAVDDAVIGAPVAAADGGVFEFEAHALFEQDSLPAAVSTMTAPQ